MTTSTTFRRPKRAETDALNLDKMRLFLYTAISNPAYICQITKDPILVAFELSVELKSAACYERELYAAYEELSHVSWRPILCSLMVDWYVSFTESSSLRNWFDRSGAYDRRGRVDSQAISWSWCIDEIQVPQTDTGYGLQDEAFRRSCKHTAGLFRTTLKLRLCHVFTAFGVQMAGGLVRVEDPVSDFEGVVRASENRDATGDLLLGVVRTQLSKVEALVDTG